MSTYVYNPGRVAVSLKEAQARFGERFARVVPNAIDNVSPPRVARILELGRAAGVNFEPLTIDVDAYRAYYKAHPEAELEHNRMMAENSAQTQVLAAQLP